ncbi:MAG: YifB family Mg chelatase-like AAA ATPase [Halioglobus sp.]|nr:YifB family Mg chelatase-like AAA ATPase [Halioglobus sp.]
MQLSVIYSRALSGIEAPPVFVETHLSNGLPAFNIVGLPETAVRESRDRVRSALLNSQFEFPDHRITVNLAPADLPKEGGRFDLPIALGILSASGQLRARHLTRHEFLGELALDGALRPVPGVVAAAGRHRIQGRRLVVAAASAARAAHVPGSEVIGAPDLLTLCAHLNGGAEIAPAERSGIAALQHYPDMREVMGQAGARRALEIAAAGCHHLLLQGPPGTGKSLLASRLPGILPPPGAEEALTALALRDIRLGEAGAGHSLQRPFRNPHHSASAAALAGGGARPQPGEISLAHGGVLFLDELPEFSRHCLEMLREPMESGEITLSRARHKITYPARFQLVAAMNPCPCGYLGDRSRACRCTPEQIQRYRARISGPLLDRIDLHIEVERVPPADLLQNQSTGERSGAIRERVCASRRRQLERQGCANGALPPDRLVSTCALNTQATRKLEQAADRLQLSGRSLHRVLRVALTIADLAGEPVVSLDHIGEALGLSNRSAGT